MAEPFRAPSDRGGGGGLGSLWGGFFPARADTGSAQLGLEAFYNRY